MNNPFEEIEARLSRIEDLLLDLKHMPQVVEYTDRSERLLTSREAAEFLSLTVPTICSKVLKGELPAMKLNKRLYFSRTELMEHLKQGRSGKPGNIINFKK